MNRDTGDGQANGGRFSGFAGKSAGLGTTFSGHRIRAPRAYARMTHRKVNDIELLSLRNSNP